MWRTLRKTLKRLVIILLLLGVAGAGIGAYYWSRFDEMLQSGLKQALANWYPDLEVELGRCHLDWFGRLHVDDLNLKLPKDSSAFLQLPETLVELDRPALIERQEAVVNSVRLIAPSLEVVRLPDGTWNWHKLPPLPEGGKSSLPNVELEDAQLLVRIYEPGGAPGGELKFDSVNITLVPNGRRSFLIDGTTKIDRVGKLSLDGDLHLDNRTGTLDGKLKGVRFAQDLVDLVSTFDPTVAQHIDGIADRLRDEMRKDRNPENRAAFTIRSIIHDEVAEAMPAVPKASSNSPVEISTSIGKRGANGLSHQIPAEWIGAKNSVLGVEATVDVTFRIHRPSAITRPDLKAVVDIRDGEITNTALPFPLSSVEGRIEWTPEQIIVQTLSGKNGPTTIGLSGTVVPPEDTLGGSKRFRGRFDVNVTDLICDQRLRSRLSIKSERLYDLYQPRGRLDVSATLATNEEGRWKSHNMVAKAKKMAATYARYPYPIHEIVGTVRQDGHDYHMQLRGYGAGREVSLAGLVRRPGPDAAQVFEMGVEDVPLDDTFLRSIDPPVRELIETMGLKGQADMFLRLTRKAGPGHRVVPDLRVRIHDSSLFDRRFPYRVDNLSGIVRFDGKDWTFTDLAGTHDAARLTGFGSYRKIDGLTTLDLSVTAEDAPLDESLYLALPESLQTVWKQFAPGGTIEKSVTKLHQVQGQPLEVSVPEISVTNSSVTAEAFPYALSSITADFSYTPGWVSIKSFRGLHNTTVVSGNGYVKLEADGGWNFHLSRFIADDLVPNGDLRRAAGPDLASVMDILDPTQKLDLVGEIDLRASGDPGTPVTAMWYTKATLSGGTLHTGIDLNNVKGTVECEGSWFGTHAEIDGWIDFSTASIHEDRQFQLHDIQGPFSFRNGTVIVGSRKELEREGVQGEVSPIEQLTAEFIGGRLFINVAATTEAKPRYVMEVRLSHGQLERFASLYLNSQDRLQGVINGWVNLQGAGPDERNMTGNGQLQISPAALYELPVVFQVLNQLQGFNQFRKNDDAAFKYALAEFDIRNGAFDFREINLVGTPLSLSGRGVASFDGRLNLAFYTRPTNNTRESGGYVPGLAEIGAALTMAPRLFGTVVEVKGTTDDPRTRVVPGRQIEKDFKSFIDSLAPLQLTLPTQRPAVQPATRSRRRSARMAP